MAYSDSKKEENSYFSSDGTGGSSPWARVPKNLDAGEDKQKNDAPQSSSAGSFKMLYEILEEINKNDSISSIKLKEKFDIDPKIFWDYCLSLEKVGAIKIEYPLHSEPILLRNKNIVAQKKHLTEKDLAAPIIRTDFDRILDAIKSHGMINAAKLRKELGVDGATLRECYLTLEKSGEIKVEYPLFGSPNLISADYAKEKIRRQLLKRGIIINENDLEGK